MAAVNASRVKFSKVKPSQAKPSQAKSSQVKSSQKIKDQYIAHTAVRSKGASPHLQKAVKCAEDRENENGGPTGWTTRGWVCCSQSAHGPTS